MSTYRRVGMPSSTTAPKAPPAPVTKPAAEPQPRWKKHHNVDPELNFKNNQTFRLFDLPAELREHIYNFALAPTGTLSLTSTNKQRYSVSPQISPNLLATCTQVHREANHKLYGENVICIQVDAHDTTWPVINEKRLPQHALTKLQHLLVLLDCTAYFSAAYSDVDFTAFSALTSLQTLRICVLYLHSQVISYHASPSELIARYAPDLLTQVLERVPADVRVISGVERDDVCQARFLESALLAPPKHRGETKLVPDSQLDEAAAVVPTEVRGCKSGGVTDVFAEYRNGFVYGSEGHS